MNTQTAVETKTTQYPSTGNGGSAPGNGGGAPGNGGEPKPQPPEEAVARLKSERVQEELKALTGWGAVQGETALECTKTFATPELAGLYGGFVAQSAAATGYPVTVNLSGGQVCVTVYTPNIDGCPAELDLSVLAFARQL